MNRLILRITCAIFCCLCNVICWTSTAEDFKHLPDRFAPLRSITAAGDCDGAWKFVWQLARQHDNEALELLVRLFVLGINPPSVEDQQSTYRRRILAMLVYGSLLDDNFGFNRLQSHSFIPKTLRDFQLDTSDGKVASCYEASIGDNSKCIDLAQSLNLVPSFEEFVRGEDKLIKENIQATCRPY